MTEGKKNAARTTLIASLTALCGAAAMWLTGHAVPTAQASPTVPQGLATAAQVAELDRKLDEYRAEVKSQNARVSDLERWKVAVEAVEAERARTASHRDRGR